VVRVPAVGALAPGRSLVEHVDLGVVAVAGLDRWALDLAKGSPERELLLRRHRLIAKQQHEVLEQRRAESIDRRLVERTSQLDARDLGPDLRGDRRHLDRHPAPPCARAARV